MPLLLTSRDEHVVAAQDGLASRGNTGARHRRQRLPSLVALVRGRGTPGGVLARPLPPARNSRPARMVPPACFPSQRDRERYEGGGGSVASARGSSLRVVIPSLGKTR